MKAIEYADTSSWEAWQGEYRYGAFYIFPPAGIIEAIDTLRRTYDPISDAYCQAHISLSEPLRQPLIESGLAELRTRLAALAPFPIRFGPLRSFLPYPGVVYTIAPEDAFRNLRSAVHATSLFAGTPLEREHIAPHMTIAEFITVERTEELLRDLRGNVPEGSFTCDAIEYAVPNSAFFFERVLTIPMGRHPQKA